MRKRSKKNKKLTHKHLLNVISLTYIRLFVHRFAPQGKIRVKQNECVRMRKVQNEKLLIESFIIFFPSLHHFAGTRNTSRLSMFIDLHSSLALYQCMCSNRLENGESYDAVLLRPRHHTW